MSLFAKLFLDTKSVFYDVTTFRYYLLVQTEPTTSARQVVGFFSKEKMSWDNNNVACILVFPPWQRKGLGQMLMAVSYELSRREGRIGGPEKRTCCERNDVKQVFSLTDLTALSSLGRKAYLAYWSAALARVLVSSKAKRVTVSEIVDKTFILPEDVISALREMNVINASATAVTVDREALVVWAQENKLSLTPHVTAQGFVETS